MPDHAHLLVEGVAESSDLRRFAKTAKQHSRWAYARVHGRRLWQEGYYERVLREDDDMKQLARYILENPVRAGLVGHPSEYLLCGSQRWSVSELLEYVG